MSDGVLTVDLRLALKNLREDVKEASKVIKDGLSKSLGLGGAQVKATRDAGNAQDQLATKTKRATSELDKQLAAWKRLQNFRGNPRVFGLPGGPMAPRPDYSGYGPTMNPTQGPMGPGGGLATSPYIGGTPPRIPVPPIIPPPRIPAVPAIPPLPASDIQLFLRRIVTGVMGASKGTGYGSLIGMNQFMGAFGGTATGGRALGAMGLSGAGAATIASGGLLAGILVLVAALKTTEKVIRESLAAAERARSLYARSSLSGLGLGFTAQRSAIAQTMGVSEDDVYKFGGALDFLAPRLKQSSQVAADSAAALAPLSYEMKIFKKDVEALFDELAVQLVPALRFFVNLMDEGAKALQGFTAQFDRFLGSVLHAVLPGAKPDKLMNDLLLGANIFAGPLGGILNRAIADTMQRLPNPVSFMKQLPVSSFERMGLVASMSNTGTDYAKRTANATEAIAKVVTQQYTRGVARSAQPLGFDPNVSNP